MRALPFLDLSFTLRVEGQLPDLPFLGPTVRGLLGHGLRQTCCGHGCDDEGRCELGESCTYAYLFDGALPHRIAIERHELDALPKPFVLLIDGVNSSALTTSTQRVHGNHVHFGVRLIGDATALAPQVATAVKAREPFGFGARSHRFQLETVRVNGTANWQRCIDASLEALEDSLRVRGAAAPLLAAQLAIPRQPCAIRFTFDTPLSLDFAANPAILGGRLLSSIQRRVWLLECGYATGRTPSSPPRSVDESRFTTISTDLHTFRVDRRSTRHGGRVVLDGLTGSAVIHGPWHDYAACLANITQFGVGLNTSFGFGRTSCVLVDSPTTPSSEQADPDQQPTPNRRPYSRIPRWVQLRGPRPSRA